MLRKFITPAVLLLVAVLSWWYIRTLDKALNAPHAAATKGPDYFMYDTVSTLMDETGQPKHRLQTAYLAHFAAQNRTELTKPHLTLHQQDNSLWSIKADTGTVFQETEQIYLAGGVVIERPRSAAAERQPAEDAALAGIKMQTEKLHIDTTSQIAQTDEAVVISNRDARVNAIGMRADLQTRTVELLAKVKGIYAPQR